VKIIPNLNSPSPLITPFDTPVYSLGTLEVGARARVVAIVDGATDNDLERQLLETGFVEGAYVELLYQGPFGNPIAIRINQRFTVALRRSEANAVLVTSVRFPDDV
jgi:ferrous iron transport protein A